MTITGTNSKYHSVSSIQSHALFTVGAYPQPSTEPSPLSMVVYDSIQKKIKLNRCETF